MKLLDDVMPAYDVREFHELWMPCEPAAAYEAALAVTAREVRLLAPLMAVRRLPGALRGRGIPGTTGSRPLIDEFQSLGFLPLADEPGSELVMGAVGRFWSPSGNAPLDRLRTPEEFIAFDEPGYAKTAVSAWPAARLHPPQHPNLGKKPLPDGGGCPMSTETRVVGTSPDASRRFRVYWTLIRPGSSAIRRSWLAAIRRRAASSGRPTSR